MRAVESKGQQGPGWGNSSASIILRVGVRLSRPRMGYLGENERRAGPGSLESATPPVPGKIPRTGRDIGIKKAGGLATRRLLDFAMSAAHTLTSGPREAGPLEPPPLGPLGFGLRGTVRLRAPGSFSRFGVTGPSTYSKPIFSWSASAAAS